MNDLSHDIDQLTPLQRATAALKAMRQAKFKPAETSDGRTVPCSIIWTYRFETDH